jgi:hypothetical protein
MLERERTIKAIVDNAKITEVEPTPASNADSDSDSDSQDAG